MGDDAQRALHRQLGLAAGKILTVGAQHHRPEPVAVHPARRIADRQVFGGKAGIVRTVGDDVGPGAAAVAAALPFIADAALRDARLHAEARRAARAEREVVGLVAVADRAAHRERGRVGAHRGAGPREVLHAVLVLVEARHVVDAERVRLGAVVVAVVGQVAPAAAAVGAALPLVFDVAALRVVDVDEEAHATARAILLVHGLGRHRQGTVHAQAGGLGEAVGAVVTVDPAAVQVAVEAQQRIGGDGQVGGVDARVGSRIGQVGPGRPVVGAQLPLALHGAGAVVHGRHREGMPVRISTDRRIVGIVGDVEGAVHGERARRAVGRITAVGVDLHHVLIQMQAGHVVDLERGGRHPIVGRAVGQVGPAAAAVGRNLPLEKWRAVAVVGHRSLEVDAQRGTLIEVLHVAGDVKGPFDGDLGATADAARVHLAAEAVGHRFHRIGGRIGRAHRNEVAAVVVIEHRIGRAEGVGARQRERIGLETAGHGGRDGYRAIDAQVAIAREAHGRHRGRRAGVAHGREIARIVDAVAVGILQGIGQAVAVAVVAVPGGQRVVARPVEHHGIAGVVEVFILHRKLVDHRRVGRVGLCGGHGVGDVVDQRHAIGAARARLESEHEQLVGAVEGDTRPVVEPHRDVFIARVFGGVGNDRNGTRRPGAVHRLEIVERGGLIDHDGGLARAHVVVVGWRPVVRAHVDPPGHTVGLELHFELDPRLGEGRGAAEKVSDQRNEPTVAREGERGSLVKILHWNV